MQNFKSLASFWSREGRFASYLIQTPQRQVFSWRGANSSAVILPPASKKLEGHIAFGLSVCLSFCSSRFYACHSLRSRSQTLKFYVKFLVSFFFFYFSVWKQLRQKFGRTSISLVTLTCGSWSEGHHHPYFTVQWFCLRLLGRAR